MPDRDGSGKRAPEDRQSARPALAKFIDTEHLYAFVPEDRFEEFGLTRHRGRAAAAHCSCRRPVAGFGGIVSLPLKAPKIQYVLAIDTQLPRCYAPSPSKSIFLIIGLGQSRG